jgi:hypothetical protein
MALYRRREETHDPPPWFGYSTTQRKEEKSINKKERWINLLPHPLYPPSLATKAAFRTSFASREWTAPRP